MPCRGLPNPAEAHSEHAPNGREAIDFHGIELIRVSVKAGIKPNSPLVEVEVTIAGEKGVKETALSRSIEAAVDAGVGGVEKPVG